MNLRPYVARDPEMAAVLRMSEFWRPDFRQRQLSRERSEFERVVSEKHPSNDGARSFGPTAQPHAKA